jgi:predicted RNA-binding Zn ribbon-like protein
VVTVAGAQARGQESAAAGRRLAGLSPADARRFRSGRACLDFCHTGGDGPLARFELLHDGATISRWLGVVLDLDRIEAADEDLPAVRELRRGIWGAAHDIVAGREISARSRATINDVAAGPPLTPRLESGRELSIARPATVSQVLSTLARDAIDLFTGPLSQRVRVCSAADCGLLFVDQSRPGARRWCSMQRCGNLAKVRRYRNPAGQPG